MNDEIPEIMTIESHEVKSFYIHHQTRSPLPVRAL